MVNAQIFERGIADQKILEAFSNVPRHLFVISSRKAFAYEDYPLPIGEGQTISQPFIVALMTKELDVKRSEKVLEIGTGSGYQAAILAYLGADVYTVERVASLAKRAKATLDSLGYPAKVNVGDGTIGWDKYAPYDRIIVTAASPRVSPQWLRQLAGGGKIVLPLGDYMHQDLTVIEKISDEQIGEDKICDCVFVPLIGKYGYKD